ncbi:NAD(P)-binding domain-containing protein [Phytohabitans sp. ZYX-F-186]|uniref:NAD(P)-binding domain-containing protein n=1 Tax=Phytohabitans maris TaxID=3071409 RepID=A0ABU0ZRN1_9ACTN|nr:NAD(P)-binding domain-containing protein [Phytohabitans sp. ZYX-F-186]MDQ7909411.1 NAD(P)-binding domain-containing protein [Phytohabitans sp. ZYX-F-186]
MTAVAVMGLGEAGRIYARDLAEAGYRVRGFDPYVRLDGGSTTQVPTAREAVAAADLVISLVGAAAAEQVARQALPHCAEHAVYADLNTGSPGLKRTLAGLAEAAGVAFTDVAVLAPVGRRGARTPLMASGGAAERFAVLVRAAGVPVQAVPGGPGAAAGRKLLRSVFMKGLAAVLLECDRAAAAAGEREWLRAQVVGELSGDAGQLVDRLIDGSRVHAARRIHEVDDAVDYLTELGQPAWVMAATRRWLASLAEN